MHILPNRCGYKNTLVYNIIALNIKYNLFVNALLQVNQALCLTLSLNENVDTGTELVE